MSRPPIESRQSTHHFPYLYLPASLSSIPFYFRSFSARFSSFLCSAGAETTVSQLLGLTQLNDHRFTKKYTYLSCVRCFLVSAGLLDETNDTFFTLLHPFFTFLDPFFTPRCATARMVNKLIQYRWLLLSLH